MRKLEKTNEASLVKQANGDWYIKWYDKSTTPSTRYREKFDMNRIKDVALRQAWANKILAFLNGAFLEGNTPSVADVKKGLSEDKVAPFTNTFKEHVEEFIELRKTLRADGTTKTQENTKRLLALFGTDVLQKTYPDYEDFDGIFPLKFQAFCFAAPRHHSANYAAKRLDHIRQFLTDAVEQGKVPVNPLWTSKKYHFKTVEVDDIALTMNELERLHKLHTEGGVYAAVRDNFVFAALTGGLRFSDFSKIKPSDFVTMERDNKSIKMIKITTKKTGDKVIVPLHPLALEILERNGGKLPKCPVNQVFNRYIKTLCKKAGLTESVSLRENLAGKTTTVEVEKYNCVSAHTARRTFATVGYLEWKVPVSVLMNITGHSTETQFFKYIKLKKEVAAFDLYQFMQ